MYSLEIPIRVPDDFSEADLFEIKDRLEPVCPGNEVYGAFIRRKKSVLDGYVLSKIVICSEKTDNQSVVRKSFGTVTTPLMRYVEGICSRPEEIP